MEQPRSKRFYEPALEETTKLSKELINTTPELRSVLTVMDWSVGSNEMPWGTVVGSADPYALLSLIRQLTLAAGMLFNELASRAVQAEAAIKKIPDNNTSSGP